MAERLGPKQWGVTGVVLEDSGSSRGHTNGEGAGSGVIGHEGLFFRRLALVENRRQGRRGQSERRALKCRVTVVSGVWAGGKEDKGVMRTVSVRLMGSVNDRV